MKRNGINRRDILRQFGIGAMTAAIAGNTFLAGCAAESIKQAATVNKPNGKRKLYERVTKPSRVALVKGNDRREIVYQSLKMIENEIVPSIGNKKILIKPNMVTTGNPLCATHPDAVRAVLDFLKPHYKKQIIIGESTAFRGTTFDGFKEYGYLPLEKEYDVKLIDLNQQPRHYGYVIAEGNRPQRIRFISTFFDPDVFIISVARMKTHDRVVVTLSLKNILLGCPVSDGENNDKFLMHTGRIAIDTILHFNMFHLAQQIYPDLSVIDGFEGMEGDGPIRGTPFDSRVALAGTDPLAADTLATKIMGFDPKRILYLSAMNEVGLGQGDIDKINVLGTPLDQCLYHFKPNHLMAELYNL